jgi:hypothetical protein
MHTDFSVFRQRLAGACRIRGMTEAKVCSSIGLSPKRGMRPSLTALERWIFIGLAKSQIYLIS